jgi:DNA adenine methylase
VLEEVHERLAGVVIENLPYDQLIPRYDRPETLFYLDPPYWGCESVYGRELFSREEFTRLAELLRGIKGRFILSLNDHPGVRKCFAGFEMEVVETTYAMGYRTGKETQRVRELLISNTVK